MNNYKVKFTLTYYISADGEEDLKAIVEDEELILSQVADEWEYEYELEKE